MENTQIEKGIEAIERLITKLTETVLTPEQKRPLLENLLRRATIFDNKEDVLKSIANLIENDL